MRILDVSKYQSTIDYAKVATQIDGVVLRCGYTGWGTANECNVDTTFEKHYAGFKAAGVPVGVYYYSAVDTINGAKREAEFCKQLLTGKQFELPIYYDVENGERMNKLTKEQLTSQVIAWCDIMEQAGYFVGVYSYTSFFNARLNVNELVQRYSIWLADYRANYDRTISRDMHQYTSTATIAGISGGVDMSNLFRTDLISIITTKGFNGYPSKEVPPSNLKIAVIGPVSNGDKISVEALGQKLGVSVNSTSRTDGLFDLTTSPMSEGDIIAFENLANQLQVGFTTR